MSPENIGWNLYSLLKVRPFLGDIGSFSGVYFELSNHEKSRKPWSNLSQSGQPDTFNFFGGLPYPKPNTYSEKKYGEINKHTPPKKLTRNPNKWRFGR